MPCHWASEGSDTLSHTPSSCTEKSCFLFVPEAAHVFTKKNPTEQPLSRRRRLYFARLSFWAVSERRRRASLQILSYRRSNDAASLATTLGFVRKVYEEYPRGGYPWVLKEQREAYKHEEKTEEYMRKGSRKMRGGHWACTVALVRLSSVGRRCGV